MDLTHTHTHYYTISLCKKTGGWGGKTYNFKKKLPSFFSLFSVSLSSTKLHTVYSRTHNVPSIKSFGYCLLTTYSPFRNKQKRKRNIFIMMKMTTTATATATAVVKKEKETNIFIMMKMTTTATATATAVVC